MDIKQVNELVGTTFRSNCPDNYSVKFDGEYTLTRVKKEKVADLGLFSIVKTKSDHKGKVKFLYDTKTTELFVSFSGGKKVKSAVESTVSTLSNNENFSRVSLVSEIGQ